MQKLISPINEAGQKRTLDDLLNDLSTPSRQAGKSNIFFFSSITLPCLYFIILWHFSDH